MIRIFMRVCPVDHAFFISDDPMQDYCSPRCKLRAAEKAYQERQEICTECHEWFIPSYDGQRKCNECDYKVLEAPNVNQLQ